MGISPSSLSSPVAVSAVSSYATLNTNTCTVSGADRSCDGNEQHSQQRGSNSDGNNTNNNALSNAKTSKDGGQDAGSGATAATANVNNNIHHGVGGNGMARANLENNHLINMMNNNTGNMKARTTPSANNNNGITTNSPQQSRLANMNMGLGLRNDVPTPAPTNVPLLPIPLQFQNDPLAVHIHRDLPQHTIEQRLGPESGRMTSTYRIRHVPSGAVMILKVMILSITTPVSAPPDSYSSAPSDKREYEYGSITQHELLMQEQEMKRMLLLVANANEGSINSITSSNQSNQINNNGEGSKRNDFTHAILPYQSWYISPFIIQSTTSSAPVTRLSITGNNTNANINTGTTNATGSANNNINTSSTSNNINASNAASSTSTSNNSDTTSSQYYITQKRPIYLLRPNVYTTLSIKIITRPFLSNAEKMYIAHQIISCIHDLHHKLNLCHGHLTCENIGVSSFLSIFLLDLMPVSGGASAGDNNRAIRPLFIPDDDPSDWIYYFQERTSSSKHNTIYSKRNIPTRKGYDDYGKAINDAAIANATSGDNINNVSTNNTNSSTNNNVVNKGSNLTSFGGGSGEKKCYIAPERFVSRSSSSSPPTKLTPAMDIFSLGCVLMELFLNGETAMDLGGECQHLE